MSQQTCPFLNQLCHSNCKAFLNNKCLRLENESERNLLLKELNINILKLCNKLNFVR